MNWLNPPQPQAVSGAHTSPKARVIWHDGKLLIGDRHGWIVFDAPEPPVGQQSATRRQHGKAVVEWTTAGVTWWAAGCSTCGWNLGGPAAVWIARVPVA